VNRREFQARGVAGAALVGAGGLDAFLEIIQRIDAGKVSMADPSVIVLLDEMAASAAREYYVQHSARLAPVVEAWRLWVEAFRTGGVQRHRAEIDAAACQLSGILSCAAADLGEHAKALAYGLEARVLADEVGDPGLRAWARAQQAFSMTKAGRHREAIELADDGLRVLGRRAEIGRPVYAWHGGLPVQRAYNLARTGYSGEPREAIVELLGQPRMVDLGAAGDYFVAEALAVAGDIDAAQTHADQALPVLDRGISPAPHPCG
jgi:hypothetical protein